MFARAFICPFFTTNDPSPPQFCHATDRVNKQNWIKSEFPAVVVLKVLPKPDLLEPSEALRSPVCSSHEFPAPVALDVPMEIVMLGTFGWEVVEYSHWEKMNNNSFLQGLEGFLLFPSEGALLALQLLGGRC